MSSRKTRTSRIPSGSRGRGTKRGLVCLNAVKSRQEHERVLNEERATDGIYEDTMVYVKDQAIITRKPRGRPRKGVLENNSNRSALRQPQNEIIYLPSVRQGSNGPKSSIQHQVGQNSFRQILLKQPQSKAVPSNPLGLKSINPCNQNVSGSNLYSRSVLATKPCPQTLPGKSNIQLQNIFRSNSYSQAAFVSSLHPQSVLRSKQALPSSLPKPTTATTVNSSLTVTRRDTPSPREKKDNWPEDLQELLDTWDSLPEQEIHRWLKSPISSSNPPPVVKKIHQQVKEWICCEGATLQQIVEALDEDCKPTSTTGPTPKVVVEAQPNAQNCGLWASMDDPTV